MIIFPAIKGKHTSTAIGIRGKSSKLERILNLNCGKAFDWYIQKL